MLKMTPMLIAKKQAQARTGAVVEESRLIRAARRIERDYWPVAMFWAEVLERWMEKDTDQQRRYLALLHPGISAHDE
jgi:hypothetical protein